MSGTKAPSSPSPSIIEAAVRLCWSESPCLPSSPLLSPAFLEKKQNKTQKPLFPISDIPSLGT